MTALYPIQDVNSTVGFNNTVLTFENYTGPLPERPLIQRGLSILEKQFPPDNAGVVFHAFGAPLFEFPLTFLFPVVAVSLYLLMVFGLPHYIQRQRDCKLAMQIWNFLLTILSLAMFVTWITSLYSDIILYPNPIYYLACLPGGSLTIGFVPIAAITFMISKYLELADTLFLILKKKEIIFLHWYHHATVLIYTWTTVILMYPPGNIFGSVNSFVHTLMYSYYFLASFGHKPWWGKYVTRIQLAQMVVGIVTTSTWAYFHYLTDLPCGFWSPQAHKLAAYGYSPEDVVFIATLVMYASYFVLFLKFYLDRFSGEGQAPAQKRGATEGKGKGKGKGKAQPQPQGKGQAQGQKKGAEGAKRGSQNNEKKKNK